MIPWIFENKKVVSVADMPKKAFGFIYEITYDDGKRYIGKKNLYNKVTLPALKSGTQRPNSTRVSKNVSGKRVHYDVMTVESNWKHYVGSKKDAGDRVIVKREILAYAPSKRSLTYLEAKYLFAWECIESEEYINNNILNKFFRDNLL